MVGNLCSEMISFACKELGSKLEMGNVSKVGIFAEIRNIYMMFQDLDRYALDMSDLYYWRMFSAPILITYSVPVCASCHYTVNI